MTTKPYFVDAVQDLGSTPVECDDCEWSGTAAQVIDIVECALTPGHISPAGRCPKCEALVYATALPDNAGLVQHVALITSFLRSAQVAVSRDEVVITGLPASLLSAIRRANDELKQLDEKENLAGFARALACICGDNVPRAVVYITFEGAIDDGGRGYTDRYCHIVISDTDDRKQPSMGPFQFSEMDDRLTCDFNLDFLEGNDTHFNITADLSKKLFKDGDYKAFLEATCPGVLYPQVAPGSTSD